MTLPPAPSDAPSRVVELTGGPASVVDEGPADAASLLLLHGVPGSARDFRWLAPALEGLRRVRVEMPGFGGTPLSTLPSVAVMDRARFVVEVSDALGLRRPVLVGHSMGGVVATAAITLAPERFRGLALIASPGLREHRGFRKIPARRWLGRALAVPLVASALRRPLRRGFRAAGFRHASDAELRHTLRCVAATDLREHARRLRRLDAPAFHAFCDDDPLVEAAIGAETAEEVGGPVLRFATGGHNPQKFHAVELAGGLRAWLEALPDPR